ncbi:uncharacterized protein LAJ45_09806 [Morchella importuna]|uniref:uncharacterized protein n=1 Tax=Morchella importuna TaxID=1174673 RepID=UPI001E8EEC02|nr:uncharacterized protein LAJ45_09806 [Morchella importuna]KAH8146116.1 hypothetical protein LAJ45_09806 [Morchella importuna]
MKFKSPISLPAPLPAAQTAPFEDDNRWKLFLTTSTKVSVWDSQGCNAVFTSGSEGIVAAKRAKDGSVLAIADSQVVMLHRIEEGQDKSYRLKGTQRCRHLQYDHDSRSLFFTDSLHNSVQSYSLKENRVADAAKPHPSSITAFAISSDSNLVVSCSAEPPITQIHNRLMATTVSITPRCSTAPVVLCSFHPSRRTIFVLAFRDGVLAAYDYSKISGGSKAKKDGKIGIGQGITGVEFVPGYRSRAVTVGEDGRLFLVDFEMRDTLGSWHIAAPATSLTIRPITVKGKSTDEDDIGGCVIAIGTIHGKCYVYDEDGNKIGEQTVDSDGGKVLDVEWVSGDIHPLPSEDGDSHSPTSPRSHIKPPPSAGAQQPAGNRRNSATAENSRPTKEKDKPLKPKLDLKEDSNQWPGVQETATQGYMTLFSPVKKRQKPEKAASLAGTKTANAEKISDPKLRTIEKEDQRSVISAPLLWNESAKNQSRPGNTKEDHSPIKKPATKANDNKVATLLEQTPALGKTAPSLQPLLRSSGTGKDNPSLLTSHRITPVASDVIKTNDKTNDGKLLSQIRSIRAKVEGDKIARGNLAIFAPYMSSKIKTSAIIRSGGAAENRKAPVLSQEKPVDPRLRALDGNRADDRMDGSVDQTDRIPKTAPQEEDATLPGPVEPPKKDEDLPSPNQEDDAQSEASFDGDIWLVGDKPSTSRKRKNSNVDDFQPSSSFDSNGDRSSSRAGSSKSRKTVSWDDGLTSRDNITPANLLREFENPSSPRFAFSGDAPWPLVAKREGKHLASNATTPETSFASRKVLSSQKEDPTSGIPSSLDENSFHTPHGPVASLMEPAPRNALVEMQTMFKAEMRGLQAEMARGFQAQMRVLEDLRSEVRTVREENVKLRDQISELSAKDREKRP